MPFRKVCKFNHIRLDDLSDRSKAEWKLFQRDHMNKIKFNSDRVKTLGSDLLSSMTTSEDGKPPAKKSKPTDDIL